MSSKALKMNKTVVIDCPVDYRENIKLIKILDSLSVLYKNKGLNHG